MLILLLFFCSGATALIYEVVWSKYLALMFGSTVQAQTVVLAVFMGGLALGNRVFGRRGDQSTRPLALYGYLEVVIGIYAFFFSFIYKFADSIFVAVGSRFVDQGAILLALKGVLSVGLLLGPTMLMGGTLPILAAWLQKATADAGRRSARFYSINSLGAVFGSGLAGFYLVETVGLNVTLQITALANVIVGFSAVGLARQQAKAAATTSEAPTVTAPVTTGRSLSMATIFVALTGGVSMGLEVLASRSLTLIFGASLQAFAIVLMAFILGIGLGSAVIASPRWRRLPRETITASLLLAAAALIGLLVMHIETWVDIYRLARTGLARTEMGYRYHQLLAGGISVVFLGIPAGMLGAVLPLWIRSAGESKDALGHEVGRLLTWNTVGAVGGVLLTGFILMPHAGLRNSFGVLALIMALGAVAIAWSGRQKTLLALAGLTCGGLALVWSTGGEGWRHVISSGVFRAREETVSGNVFEARKQHVKILFYEDAADATVSVEQTDGSAGSRIPQIVLRINGKADATSHGDLSTQYLLAHVPMISRPGSKDVFVLGLGSGVTAGALLGYPLDRLVVAENCEPVVRAARFFDPWNRGVITNSLTRIWNEDARTVLKLSPQNYDVIISEPSNPWMAGVGSVFSREFYELCASRLKPGGLMTQWFHLYEMHDGIAMLVLRTFASVFPYMEVWDPGSGDIIILGAKEPWATGPEVFQQAFAREWPRQDMERIGLRSPEMVFARQLASQRTAFAIPGDGALQSDELPILEYDAPKAFYRGLPSRLLFQYDERTWQEIVAPAPKRMVLSRLDNAALGVVFGEYSSVNPDLERYLKLRLNGLDSPANLKAAFENRVIPTIFKQTNAVAAQVEFPPGANAAMQQLLTAEMLIQASPDRWQESVNTIENLLQAAATPSGATNLVSTNFSAAAFHACLRNGDIERAKKLLLLGLTSNPADDHLLYLARILEREAKK
jgi:spermidine synthase